ncbi:MAG: hypothetical protein FJW88_13185 [Actinobacteria bacterium]|nr:hypothetical protein [Actinomycetota bacterium]
MLFVHELHRVMGAHEDEFERAYRDEWMPTLAASDDARLLYFMRHAHGTGRAYNIVTVTAVTDGRAWEELARRVSRGDLRGWARIVDGFRHDVTSKVLVPVEWSPLQEVELGRVPLDGGEHDQSLFMEDTAWPHAGLMEDYLTAARDNYAPSLAEGRHGGRSLLELQAVFTAAWGTSARRREVILWQRVTRPAGITGLVTSEVPPEHKAPGTWMHDALRLRDDWESRLLRTSAWSPLF